MIRFAGQALVIAAVVFASSHLDGAAQVTSTYSGSADNWTTAAWSNSPAMGGFPNNGNAGVATYDAVLSGTGTLTLDQDIAIQKFTMAGGTVNGSFNLTTNDLLHWTGGYLSGTGVTNANGGLSIDGFSNYLDTRTLNISGATSLTGSASTLQGIFYLANGATINNSGTFDAGWSLNYNNFIALYTGTLPVFNNTGTFTRSVGTGTTDVSVKFNNSNIVNVQAGTLQLDSGGTESGAFQVGSGAALTFFGTGMTFADGTTLSGPGAINISGTVSVAGPAVTFSGGGSLNITTNGTLAGGGTLTATSPIHWSGGYMSGAGVTNANGGLSIDGSFSYLDTRTLNIGGTASLTGSASALIGYLYLSNGATVNVKNSGTFDSGWSANYDNYVALYTGTNVAFNNDGTFTRSVGTGTTHVSIPFNNTNMVTVHAGTLSLTGGGTESGSFQVSSGAALEIGGSGTTFAAGSSLSGQGNINITGTATITAPLLNYSGGGSLSLTNTGTINGAGTLTATSPIHWSGGTMSGSGITNANGGLSIDGSFNYLDTRTLNIGSTASLSGSGSALAGYLYLSNNAVINITNSGTLDTGWSLNYNNAIAPYSGTGTVNNSGTFTRSVGNGTTFVQVPFNNSNIVSVQAGTLEFDGGGTETGAFQVGPGATLAIGGTAMTFAAGSSLSGLGNININCTATITAPLLTYSGGGSLNLTSNGAIGSGGTLTAASPIHWTGGYMSGTGITNANGGLSIDGVFNFLDTRTLNINGPASLSGSANNMTGYLYLANGATVNITNAGTFDTGWSLNFDNAIALYTGTGVAVHNSGTFTRSAGSGTTFVQVPFANNGAVSVGTGKLEFDSDFSMGNNSSLNVSGGVMKFVVNSGTASVGSGATATISGTGVLELASSVSVLGVASPAADRVTISNTSSAAAGLLVSAGHQQVGAISGTGNVQINANASLTANSIIAGALTIGGQSGIPGKATIAVSNASGLPLDSGADLGAGAVVASSSSAGVFSGSGDIGFYIGPPLDAGPEPVAGPTVDASPVPEPSAIVILVLALLGLPPLVGRRRSQ